MAPAKTQIVSGSSPRPWGTLERTREADPIARFIPTPVGNTDGCSRYSCLLPVHPHARGEHSGPCAYESTVFGSSTRPWGTLPPERDKAAQCRFIPTPVGNTLSALARICERAVHPHARGEHHSIPMQLPATCGSSPRPWGTLHRRG